MPIDTYTHHAITLEGVTRTYTSTPGYCLLGNVVVARLGGGHGDQPSPGSTRDFWNFVVDTVDAEVDHVMQLHHARVSRPRIVAEAVDRACLIGSWPFARITAQGAVGDDAEVTVEQLVAWVGRVDRQHVVDSVVSAVYALGAEQ